MPSSHSHEHDHSHECNPVDIKSHHTHEDHDHSHEDHDNDRLLISDANNEKERRHEVLWKLKTASFVCFSFLLVEVVGGILAGSLAVLSDAAHLAADLSAFAVAIIGSHIASLPASEAHTFGLKRTESLAALFSMVSLAILSIGLAIEAIHRLWIIVYYPGEEKPVDGKLMATIAFIGVLVNVILAYILGEDHVHMPGVGHDHDHSHEHGGHQSHDDSQHHDEESFLIPPSSKNLSCPVSHHINEVQPQCESNAVRPARNVNLSAAYLHVLADLAQSVIVLTAGLLIFWKPTWQIVDPICTLIFSIMVCFSTMGVIKSSLSVLLEEVPPGVEWDEIYDSISQVNGVSNVHDLHIWSISHGNFILSVHATAEKVEQAYKDIKRICNKRNISHLTLQIQPSTIDDCVTCTEGSVHQCR